MRDLSSVLTLGRDDLHDVVLEEDPEPFGDSGTAVRDQDRGGDRARRDSGAEREGTQRRTDSWFRRHWVPLTVAAVVVLVTLGAGVVDVVREREHALDPSIAEAWSLPGGWEHSLILGPAATIGDAGLTIAIFATDDGSVLVANDLDTGVELWRAPLPALRGRPRDTIESSWRTGSG